MQALQHCTWCIDRAAAWDARSEVAQEPAHSASPQCSLSATADSHQCGPQHIARQTPARPVCAASGKSPARRSDRLRSYAAAALRQASAPHPAARSGAFRSAATGQLGSRTVAQLAVTLLAPSHGPHLRNRRLLPARRMAAARAGDTKLGLTASSSTNASRHRCWLGAPASMGQARASVPPGLKAARRA